MNRNERDEMLVTLALRELDAMALGSLQEEGAAIGVSDETVRRWRNGGRRLQKDSRPKVEAFLKSRNIVFHVESRGSWEADVVSRLPDGRLVLAEVKTDRAGQGQAVEELLDLMGVKGGLRRAFREYAPEDLVILVYRVGMDDGWPADEMAKVDKLRDRILTGAPKSE